MAETPTSLNCSLNTTECILETLAAVLGELKAQRSEYNWDPLTFGVTAAIGILALIVAVLTVGQGLIAAGPGRLKSSRNALGPWAKFSRRTFDRTEMRFRTIAYTPVLVVPHRVRPSRLAARDNATYHEDVPYWYRKIEDEEEWSERELSGLLVGGTYHFPATWLALLTSAGLDDIELWERKPTGADYIPAEMPAVPAYGSIGVVIALAAAYSEDELQLVIDSGSNLPRIQSREFSVVFRHHPSLGVVGFYENHRGRIESRWGRHATIAMRSIMTAQGNMESSIRRQLRHDSSGPDPQHIFDNWLTADSMHMTRDCPCQSLEDIPNPACCSRDRVAPWTTHCAAHPWMDTNDKYSPASLVLAVKPLIYPKLFPIANHRLREKLHMLLIQSRFWAMKPPDWENLNPAFEDGFTLDLRYVIEKAMTWAQRVVAGPVVQLDLSLKLHRVVVICIADLYSSRWNLDPIDRFMLFRGMLEEIHKITEWLSSIRWPDEKGWAEEIRCRQRAICGVGSNLDYLCREWDEVNTPKGGPEIELVPPVVFVDNALHGVLCTIKSYTASMWANPFSRERKPFLPIISTDSLNKVHNLWELDGSSPPKFKLPDDVQHPLDDLLIYRAVLIAIVYSSTQDTSSLINNNLFDMVVPIA